MELAEEGGFEAVRLRDLASHADVALGTLYKRFRSKAKKGAARSRKRKTMRNMDFEAPAAAAEAQKAE